MVKLVLLPTCALLEARLREESPRTSSTFSQSYPRISAATREVEA